MEDTYVIEHIKKLCKQRGWTVYRLAKNAGMPYSSLNYMLKHNHIPTINNLIKICNGFDITLSQFFSAIEDKSEGQNEFLGLWDTLDEVSKNYVIAYMKGLAKLPIINNENI